jgi:tetratricopeptide (TPR) repeat protein
LSNAHLDLGQIERASQVAQTATRVRADSARTWIQLAQVENVIALRARDGLRKRAFEASAKAYLRALELSPEDADLHDNLGNTYQTLGRPAEAVAHHERAIALKPDRVESRLNYGNVLLMLGQLEDAVEQYRRVLAQDPEYVRAWLNLSLTLQRLGQDEEAAQAIARARGLGWEPTP